MLRLHMAKLLEKATELGDTTIADMAQRTNINRSTLHRLAAGTKQPSLTTLWTLHTTYKIHLATLVYNEQPTSPPPPITAPSSTRLPEKEH